MKIDDFKKKENPVMKFMNKYFGLKYSIIFTILKEMTKSKPTVSSFVASVLVGYILYFMIRYSNYFLWLIGIWLLVYVVQITNKIYKSKQKKHGKRIK